MDNVEHIFRLRKAHEYEVTVETVTNGIGFVDFEDERFDLPRVRYRYQFSPYHEFAIELWDGDEPSETDKPEFTSMAKKAAIDHLKEEYHRLSFFEENGWEGMYDPVYVDRLGGFIGEIDAEEFLRENGLKKD